MGISKIEILDEAGHFTVGASNYVIVEDGSLLYPVLNHVTERLGEDAQLSITNTPALFVKKIDKDTTAELTGATLKLISEQYKLSGGKLTLNSEFEAKDYLSWDSNGSSMELNGDSIPNSVQSEGGFGFGTYTITVYRLTETDPPKDYRASETDTILLKNEISSGGFGGFGGTKTVVWYKAVVPAGQKLTEIDPAPF